MSVSGESEDGVLDNIDDDGGAYGYKNDNSNNTGSSSGNEDDNIEGPSHATGAVEVVEDERRARGEAKRDEIARKSQQRGSAIIDATATATAGGGSGSGETAAAAVESNAGSNTGSDGDAAPGSEGEDATAVTFDTSKSNLVNFLETTVAPSYLRRNHIVNSSSAGQRTAASPGRRNDASASSSSSSNTQQLPRVMNPRSDTDVIGKGGSKTRSSAAAAGGSAAPVPVSTNLVPSAILHGLSATPALKALHLPFSEAQLSLSSVEDVQLLGLFGAHDDDADGFVTQAQLSSCLQMLGAVPTPKLIDRYVDLEGSRTVHLTEAEVRLLSAAAKKNLRMAPLARKVSLATFLEITSQILPDLRTRVQHDANILLDFLTRRGDSLTDAPSFDARGADLDLTVKMLRQVLVDSFSPASLSKAEFVAFMKAAGVPVGAGFEALDEHRTPLSAAQFKKNLLL